MQRVWRDTAAAETMRSNRRPKRLGYYSQVFIRHLLAIEVIEQELLAVLVRIDYAHIGLLSEVEDRLEYLPARLKDWRVDVERAHDWNGRLQCSRTCIAWVCRGGDGSDGMEVDGKAGEES